MFQEIESENTSKLSYLAELMKTHEEERRKSKRYLHALEQDNEVRIPSRAVWYFVFVTDFLLCMNDYRSHYTFWVLV